MNQQLILMLIAAYLFELNNPGATDAQIAAGVTSDLNKFSNYLKNLDISNL